MQLNQCFSFQKYERKFGNVVTLQESAKSKIFIIVFQVEHALNAKLSGTDLVTNLKSSEMRSENFYQVFSARLVRLTISPSDGTMQSSLSYPRTHLADKWIINYDTFNLRNSNLVLAGCQLQWILREGNRISKLRKTFTIRYQYSFMITSKILFYLESNELIGKWVKLLIQGYSDNLKAFPSSKNLEQRKQKWKLMR